MKYSIIYLLLLLSSALSAQYATDFESLGLPVDSFDREAFDLGGRYIGEVYLPNDYNPVWDSWTGTLVVTGTDTTTPGFTNQYSAITGQGANGSTHYVMSFSTSSSGLRVIEHSEVEYSMVTSLHVTNSTYAALSMRNGDSVAKRFGGITGDDPDFFLLTIRGYDEGLEVDQHVDFYLADYRFDDNSMDYIVDDWVEVDLTALGEVDSLSFTLSSSDVGQFGMNTPAYFAIDDVVIEQTVDTETPKQVLSLSVYPNPTTDIIYIDGLPSGSNSVANVYDLSGRIVKQVSGRSGTLSVSLDDMAAGTYLLDIRLAGRPSFTQLFEKY